ncbi:MAG: nucleotidyltransferase family protein [Bacteroidales bacterium]|nr:nucleotidyltransferase family protein [Bacteroidales bacterium]
MIRLALSPVISQDELDSVVEGWDAASAPFNSQIIAFNLAKNHPEVSFPKNIQPLLQQAAIFSRKRHLEILPHFSRVVKVLENKEIPFILIKGGAMRAYRPERPRWTADIDILVPEDKYEEVLKETEKMGYILHRSPHSSGLREPSSDQDFVDIHHYVSMDTGKERNLNEPLTIRAITLPFSSSSVKVPCPEDMVFISLVNFWKNVTHISRENSKISFANLCFDLMFLNDRSGGLDWDVIRTNARITGSVETVYLAARVLDLIIPGFFPKSFMEEETANHRVKKLISRTLFTRNVICPLRDEIGEFDFGKALKQKRNPFKYIYLRVKYFIVKRFPAGGFKTKG